MSTPVTVAETQEKIHRSKTKQADPQSGYLEEKIVGSEYINITEEDGSVGKRLVVEVDAAAIVSGVVDHKVKVDTSDVAEFLENKITAGTAIAITEKTVSGKKNLEIAGAYTAGVGISITDDEIASTITQVVTENPFTGHTTKVPTSKAVADLLKALTVTSATNCGSSGNSIMWKTISIPVTNSCVCEGGQADFTDHYPSTFAVNDLVGNQGLTFAERTFGLKLITTESTPPSAEDGFGAVFLEAMIDEDCADNNTIFLDVVVQTKYNGGNNAQTNLKCMAIGQNEGQSIRNDVKYEKILDAAGNGLYKKVSFEMDLGGITAGSPFAIKFFLCSGSALIAPDAGYQSVDEFTLLSVAVVNFVSVISLFFSTVTFSPFITANLYV
ncbi:MAG: hypothetical protein BWY74_01308 [Firmicutes bacterium ADurb.Bin419]|nr:MAG: hypothetical protein BWY74_01308 [Firmicutes bacterium ADurb.Bin419]